MLKHIMCALIRVKVEESSPIKNRLIFLLYTYLATYPPVGPAAPMPAGGGPLPPTPPSSPPFQIASSSLNSFDLFIVKSCSDILF